MTVLDAMKARHAVRQYQDRDLDPVTAAQLQHDIDLYNGQYGLRIQLVTNEPDAFSGFLARRSKFRGVRHYLALVGPKGPDLAERAGYCGEKLAVKAQALGLNSCWAAMTYSKRKARVLISPGEKLVCVIAIGYGATRGRPHQNKPMSKLYQAAEPVPDWFLRGTEAAMLAPTAMNRQNFRFVLNGDGVKATAPNKVDLGIVKYHFETGAGTEHFHWIQ